MKPLAAALICFLCLAWTASYAQTTKAQLETSETFFTLAAALNSCGYDAGMPESLPLRQVVREEIHAAVQKSPDARHARDSLCQFWQDHQEDMSQYISLALNLGPPPDFPLSLPEADLPPDAAHILGIISLLEKFYKTSGVSTLWGKHHAEYQALVQQFHTPLAKVIRETDLYLRLPFSSYAGERFVIYLEPLFSPARVNSRNYGSNYYVVVSPGKGGGLRMEEIRHTYLHFVLEPLAAAHGTSMKRLEPLLENVQAAPMDPAFKNDISLLVNECLIRAIEIRTSFPQASEEARRAYVEQSVKEGFVLTEYFYDALRQFEKGSAGLRTSYGDLLYAISLDRERKHARETAFASEARPEVVTSSKPVRHEEKLLDTAEEHLAAGDAAGAQKLAQQVLQHNSGGEDPGRAAFIMARAATRLGNMEEARSAFAQTVASSHDPRTLAWSHIYLARIYDIQQNRTAALEHYRAALAAGDSAPDTRTAAEQGLAVPYAPPRPHQ